MSIHHGQMESISRREVTRAADNVLRALRVGLVDRDHLVHHPEQSVERQLDCVTSPNGYVSVQDLLQNLGVGHEAIATGN